jgi:phenylalanyl-tRNA synthetase alpha chain
MSHDKDISDIRSKLVKKNTGSIHPINQTKYEIFDLLSNMGFKIISGPEIESEKYNFDLLNIKKSHPARQMHDTFYVEKKNYLLRTHTSPVQVRAMLENKPPFSYISGGKVYRKDDDSTHLPMFHQVEGILIDKEISFSNLKYVIYQIVYSLFGKDTKIRFRPSYFPFTEPSAEVDILSVDGKWLEILGCGVINPIVLDNCNIDPNEYSGFAFGLGVERIAMLKYGVNDIRNFYKSNLDFLNQFK